VRVFVYICGMEKLEQIIMFNKQAQTWDIKTKFDYLLTLQVSDIKANALIWMFDEVYFFIFSDRMKGCVRCLDKHLDVLKTKGKTLIMNKLELQKRTCKPNFKGLRYIGGAFHGHYLAETLTDKQAVEMLNAGVLKETDFDVLPEMFHVEQSENVPPCNFKDNGKKGEIIAIYPAKKQQRKNK
jgi:hypothetical protein